MRARVVTPPQPVVTWEEARAHLRLDGDDEQLLVEAMIAAATGHIDGPEGWLGRAIGVQTIEARFDCFEGCGNSLRLPFPPLIDLVSVKYLDGACGEQTADLEDFELFGDRIMPVTDVWAWVGCAVRPDAIRIRYRAGYVVDAESDPLVAKLPASIRAAILLMTGDLYANRETVMIGASASAVPMSTTVESLLAPYRVFS
ncbi:head-tail connector protein [Sphingomonas montanisoli]|uniref:Phage gp6-like head-tail connector protein n=1 Tax=Sphingomonas montanisoli TaxID=2606412 RepID=A0A5D9C5V5_9SPHN|nr:head-tail connector protein [Sphingomonas montanisoli]TZG26502.1 phage gp6-like head-tail connector protein [Sphingomonas montanisoli]